MWCAPLCAPHELTTLHAKLVKRLSQLEDKTQSLTLNHDTLSRNIRNQLNQLFDALRELMTPPTQRSAPKRPIGSNLHMDKGIGSGSASNSSKTKTSSAAAKDNVKGTRSTASMLFC